MAKVAKDITAISNVLGYTLCTVAMGLILHASMDTAGMHLLLTETILRSQRKILSLFN
jgi:hypothetical protein